MNLRILKSGNPARFQLIQLTHWKRAAVEDASPLGEVVFPTNPINALEASGKCSRRFPATATFPTNPINALEARSVLENTFQGTTFWSFQLIQLTHWKRGGAGEGLDAELTPVSN